MNRHFEDARYYLGRAVETARRGVREEFEPAERRLRGLTGRERQTEPGRLERARGELRRLETRAEGEARKALGEARGRLEAYRQTR